MTAVWPVGGMPWLWFGLGLLLLPFRDPRRAPGRHGSTARRSARRVPPWLLAGLSLALATAALGGWPGVLLAAPVGMLAGWLVRRFGVERQPAPDRRSVAFVVDLFAAALGSGAPVELAIASVADAVGDHGTPDLHGAIAPLRQVGRLLQLGSDPTAAWATIAAEPGFQPVAAAGQRCAHSGARLAEALAVTAAELRSAQLDAAVAKAERVGIWALLPLGCCFLPAFVCIGVVPVVAGVASQVLVGH